MKSFYKILKCDTFYDANKKNWHGIKVDPLYGPNESIGVIALQSLLQEPEHISQICFNNGKTYTNFEIAQLSVSVAVHLKNINTQQCDIIGLCTSNSDFLAPLFFGAMLAGLTVSSLDPSFDKDGICHTFSITKPKLMFCDGNIYNDVKEALKEINLNIPIFTMKDHREGVRTIDEFLKENVDVRSYSPEPLKFGSNQVAAILCSSGTTGKPKGVCMSHASLLNNHIILTDSSDRFLCLSTLYWLSGLITLVTGTITGVSRIISDRPYSPDDFLEIIQKYKPTILFTPPSNIAMALASPKLKNYDLSSIITYLCGGSAVHHSLVENFQPYIPNGTVIVGYGMSEICSAIAVGESSTEDSVGKLAPNMVVKIINDDGQHLGPSKVGEICIKAMYPWAGYYSNEQATKEIYIDGWIHSGDLGYFDEEGKLYIIDRKKDILKYNNFHFFPTEIEGVINRLPGIVEVCVCGIPDHISSHLPAAAIVRTADSTLTKEEVYDYVVKYMAHFKHLRGGVYFLDSLPKTPSGKNIRREVTKILENLRNDKILENYDNGNVAKEKTTMFKG